MKSAFHKKSSFNHLLIVHIIDFKFHSDYYLFRKHKKDENEQKLLHFISDKEKFKIKPYYDLNEVYDFLSTKYKAMETIDLDDECCSEGKIETRKININKNIFPKSKHSKNIKSSVSPKNKINQNNSKNKSNNKNIIINKNGKIEKSSMKSIDLIDENNFEISKEINESELDQLFSDKALLTSIINEMKGE